ncbi:unnamed protein product [Albugo candida]|uniref:ZZ-type domain-containing protein n=2 Tax=Albugo candida TaxID=65357 RepID=A0A024GJF5_9STRA|nr:unnamed protein product [Albugo candida]|eukprot:CCI46857.1 unnamed protein product [Albugo candida]
MSRFSLVNVMGRRTSDIDSRPSIISTNNLNKQLTEEKKQSDQHLFFGPQQHVFDGGERTRVIHGERTIRKNAKRVWLVSEPLSMERDSTTSLMEPLPEPYSKHSIFNGTVSTLTAASRFLGQKMARIKSTPNHIHNDSFCEGCGMDPIVGNMFTCSKCENYSLCETCYETGVHGYEDSELIRSVREDFALRSIMETCRNRVPETVFQVLMKKVCKGQVDKFNFMSTWIAQVVLGAPLKQLSVRGIEIPHLDSEARSILVGELTPVLAERNDMEICMEWFNPNADDKSATSAEKKLQTLRIWISTDKYKKSPFGATDDDDCGAFGIPSSPCSIGSPRSPSSSPKVSQHTITSPRLKDSKVSMSPSSTAVSSSTPPSPSAAHSPSDTNSLTLTYEDSNSSCESACAHEENSDISTQMCAETDSSGRPSQGVAM